MNIASTNLNLFVAFDALVAEGSVSRAAKRVGITQSAMSNALKQLRTVLDDPLFTRVSHGIVPTPRALALAVPVREAMRLLEGSLSPRRFDPGSARRTFVLLASDYVELVLLPPLLGRLGEVAPGVRIEVRPWGLHEVPEALQRSEADLMVGFYDKVPLRHRSALLFDERYVCVVRRGHPVVKKTLTLQKYVSLRHILVSQKAGATSGIDRALAARGLSREVAVRVSHFLNVPALVARTDLVAALSARIAEPFARAFDLRVLPPPLPLPKSRIGMVWHEATDTDPAQVWLRALVREVSREV